MAERDLVVRIIGDSRSLERAFLRSTTNAKAFNATIISTGRALATGLGVGAAVTGLAGVGLAFRSTLNAAVDFEQSFVGVRKTVEASEAQFAVLSDQFRELAREIPVSVNELNRIGEAAGQLGVQREAILGFTETVAALAVTTNLAADDAANALARIANITGLPQEQFDRLGATLVDLGNQLAANEAEIVEFALRIAGAGKQVGLAESEILAIGGAFASVGVEAEAGGTAVQKVLSTMQSAALSGGKQLAGFAKVAGQSANEFRRSFQQDAGEAFTDFVEGLDRIRQAGGNTFATLKSLGIADQRLVRAFLSLAGAQDLLRRSIDEGADAFRENNALTNEAEKFYGTAGSKIQRFRNIVNDLQITIGNLLVPSLLEAVEPLQNWLDSTANQERVQKAVADAVQVTRAAVVGFRDAIQTVAPIVQGFADAVGGAREAVRLLVLAFLGFKAQRILASLGNVTTGIVTLGRESTRAKGRAGGGGVLGLVGALVGLQAAQASLEAHDVNLPRDLFKLGELKFDPGELLRKFATFGEEEAIRRHGANAGEQAGSAYREGFLGSMTPWLDRLVGDAGGQITDAHDRLSREIDRAGPVGGDAPQRRRATAAQRNTWFDAMLGRQLDRLQDLPNLQAQLRQLGSIADVIQQQISRVTDITRKLTLRDRLLEVQRQMRAVREQIGREFLDSLSLGLERAGLTATLRDDLAAVNALIAGINRQIQALGRSNDLERQRLSALQQRAQLLEQQRQAVERARSARQFRALGLGPEGEERIPGLRNLRAQLGRVTETIQGTFLDTRETRGVLARIRRVLSGGLGQVADDVRATIRRMLDDIEQELRSRDLGPQTIGKKLDVSKMLEGIGLSAADRRELQGRLSQIGPDRRVPRRGPVAFGQAVLAGAAPIQVHTTINLDGREVATVTTRHQQRSKLRNPDQRRGAFAGGL